MIRKKGRTNADKVLKVLEDKKVFSIDYLFNMNIVVLLGGIYGAFVFIMNNIYSKNAEKFYRISSEHFTYITLNHTVMQFLIAFFVIAILISPFTLRRFLASESKYLKMICIVLCVIVYFIVYAALGFIIFLKLAERCKFLNPYVIVFSPVVMSFIYTVLTAFILKSESKERNAKKRSVLNRVWFIVLFELCFLGYYLGALLAFIAPITHSPEDKKNYEILKLYDSNESVAVLAEKGGLILVCGFEEQDGTLFLDTCSYYFVNKTDGVLSFQSFDQVTVVDKKN